VATGRFREAVHLLEAKDADRAASLLGTRIRLRYSPQFIVNNADELLAIAHSELVRAMAKGVEIEDPVGWTINCAWRRTQTLHQAEMVRPRMVSGESVAELIDEAATSPEDQALDDDRARRVRGAVAKLDEGQRQVIALTFFEEMSVREAAQHLGCSPASVQHRRETALETLRRFLPFRTGDDMAVDIATACWISLALGRSGPHLPAGFEAVIDRAEHGATGLWGRAQDLARRFGVGGGDDAATAVASSGAGRAAGVCATSLAVVCLAGAGSGLVGPGIDGLGGHKTASSTPPEKRPVERTAKAVSKASRETAPLSPLASRGAGVSASSGPGKTEPTAARHSLRSASDTQPEQVADPETLGNAEGSTHHEEVAQVEEETSAIAKAGAESTVTSAPAASASDESSSGSPTVVHKATPAPSPSPASEAAAAEQFGFEH
jgi:RNA polymerase sigma factor (sigma-70 family)